MSILIGRLRREAQIAVWVGGPKIPAICFDFGLLTVLWVAMSVLIQPFGDFPVNDDWVYALSVKSLLQTGRFALPSPASANVFTQAYWGALFCLPFGFSFTALRFSTLTLGLAGITALYLLVRESGGSRGLALLSSLALTVNPLYFGLAASFMTDVPFLALTTIALWLFVRGLRRDNATSLALGILVALAAVLIRQFAILLLFAFAVAYIMHRGSVTGRTLAVAIVPLAVGIGLHIGYQRWLLGTGRMPALATGGIRDFIPTWFGGFTRESLRYSISSLLYIGLFVAPIAVFDVLTKARAGDRAQWPTLGVATTAILVTVSTLHLPLPALGNVLAPFGLGPLTLRDTYILHRNIPAISAGMAAFWVALTAVGALGAAWVLLCVTRAAAQVVQTLWNPVRRQETWLQAGTLTFVCTYAALLLVVSATAPIERPLFDRYLLPFIPAILTLAALHEAERVPAQRWFGGAPFVILIALGAFSVAATHDYLAWNRARWEATSALMRAGVPPRHIDGGYEFSGWYLYDPRYRGRPGKSYWWVDDDEYVIASGPLDGYREMQRTAVSRWLPLEEDMVLTMHRDDTAPAFMGLH